jgi:hypothetical protein
MTDRIRAALLELGDVPPPPDLAGSALARARRDRRRRVTGLIAGVAVLAAAAVTVPTLVLGRTTTEPAAGPETHVIVAGYTAAGVREPVGDGLTQSRVWDAEKRRYYSPPSPYRVYDRASGRYTLGPWKTTVPSPDGRWVAVSGDVSGGWKVGIVAADRVLDPAAVRWVADGGQPGGLPTAYDSGVWSPDGSRLYLNSAVGWIGEGSSQRLDLRGLVVDPRTGATSALTITRPQAFGESNPSNDSDPLVFGPRGVGFAVASILQYERTPTKGELALYDERGTLTRTVPIGPLQAPQQPFSPDGRLIALHTLGDRSTRVLSVADGAEVGRAEGAVVGWVDDGHYAVRVGASVRVIELASGRVVTEREVVPAGHQLYGVWLARVEGPVPPGAIVL